MTKFDFKEFVNRNKATLGSLLDSGVNKQLLVENKVRDINGHPINIGSKVMALKDLNYMMGQIDSDMISKGEVCTVDNISRNGSLFFVEHADRYGPWPSDAFKLVGGSKLKETDEFATDDFEKEPSKKDMSSDKTVSGSYKKRTLLTKLTKEKNDLLTQLKSGAINIDQYKQKIGTIPQQIKTLTADFASMTNIEDENDTEVEEAFSVDTGGALSSDEPVDWQDFFEKYDDADLNGPSSEMAIDQLIDEAKSLIAKQVDPNDVSAARKAISRLWIEKINVW